MKMSIIDEYFANSKYIKIYKNCSSFFLERSKGKEGKFSYLYNILQANINNNFYSFFF